MKKKLTLILRTTLALLFIAGSWQSMAQKVNLSNNWGAQGVTLLNQDSQGLTLNFSVQDYLLTETIVDKNAMKTITMNGVMLQNTEGAPNLPGYSRYIAVPQGATVKTKIIRKQKETVSNISIAPAPRIPLDTETGPLSYKKNQNIYSKDAVYPENLVQISEPMKIRGMDVVLIAISPFQYNPITNELTITKDLEIEVTFEGGNAVFGEDRLRNRWWDPIIRDAVINQASIPELKLNNSSRSGSGSEYIIIVPDDAAFLAWADSIRIFRLKQGISTVVVTTAEIGGNTTAAIEDYINNAYNTWDVPPAAALLIGDYGTSGNTITSPIWDNYCISDNYYGDVDNDMMPDVVMARMTAQDETQLETMVTKFLNYERNPPTNPDFYNNPITAMGWQTERWFQICSEVVAGFFENELGKTPVRENALYIGNANGPWSSATNTSTVISYFGESGLNYIPDSPSYLSDWGGNATRVNNDINNGAFLLQHRDHGSETGWGEPSYNSGNIDGLTNTDLVFVFSINCLTGKFNIGGECFAEKFHRYKYNGENSGCLGIIAATEVSYSFVNDTYTWGMYDNMWPAFMPDYGTTPEHRGVLPAFGNAAGKYFLQQSSWPYNTNNKEVTYYLFHHHGDAFSTLYTVVPQNLTVVHDDILLSGLDYFTINANSGSTICLTVGEEVIGIAEGTGSPIDIPITAQEPGTLIDVVITLQDYYRYESVVEVIPPNGPYCLYANHVINDTLSNGNNVAEFDEEVLISLTVKNLGSENAFGVDVTLITDEWVTFIDSVENYDTINMGVFKTRDFAYKFHVSDGIPDQHQLEFEVLASDENDSTWSSKFYTTVYAPTITPGTLIVDDSQTGNNNGHLDPGETADLKVTLTNTGHCMINDIICTLTPFNQYITVNSGSQTLPTLGLFGSSYPTFNVTVADDAPNAIIAEMLFNTCAAGYDIDETYYPKIGIFVEDWETGDFSKYNWEAGGEQPWEVINLYPYEGNYHGRSGQIGDGETSELEISYNVLANDNIRFYKKISSEPDFDKLIFYIDNNEIADWSGSESWTHESFPVTPGLHTFKWVYEKDFSGVTGSDCAWIDYIELPTMLVTTLFAGPDDETCQETDYQCMGSATNFTSVLWLTSGDGVFNFPSSIEPIYTPGSQDIIDGNVELTLTIIDVDGDTFEDDMLLTYINAPNAPNTPLGPDYVDVFHVFETEYATEQVMNATGYTWILEPSDAGTIISVDTFAVVQWNTSYLGEASLSVAAVSNCGISEQSEILTVIVDNTVGVANIADGQIQINIMPNPNSGIFTLNINTENSSPITITMVNYLGAKIFEEEFANTTNGLEYQVDENNLPAGIYIISLEQENSRYTRKVLIGK
jgi:hypothetical protein